MLWQGRRESGNVEDYRGRGSRLAIGGGIGAVVTVVVALLFGVDPSALLGPSSDTGTGVVDPAQDEAKHFVGVVLASTEDVWTDLFAKMGRSYREPKLALFSGRVESACGLASSAVGPFYCPEDEKAYLDLTFFDDLRTRFRASGDFAAAYVVAHEIGHHVQHLLGTMEQAKSRRASETEANRLSVRLELQADFLAGVWAHHAQQSTQILEAGDLEEALRAAAAIGDDRLQKRSQGYVVPDAFTHGTSEQRVRWFRKGFETGDVSQGDTLSIPYDQL
jgi:uncharacterized protein